MVGDPKSTTEGGAATDASMTTEAAATTEDPGAPTTEAVPTTGGSGGVAGECNLWDQDCPPGAKCVPFDSAMTGVVDKTRCVEIAESPGKAGDPCVAEGGVVGLDDCELGLLCWLLDGEGHGTCTPMCEGNPDAPVCAEGLVCDISTGGLLPLCLTTCNPLSPSCPSGQICIPSMAQVFVCDGDVSGDAGAYGDPCEFLNVCDPGLLCVAGQNVPGCQTNGCCTEFCDLSEAMSMPNQCSGAPEQECVPFFDGGAAPPGLEDVGLCAIKQ
jgi:hypothetical protein